MPIETFTKILLAAGWVAMVGIWISLLLAARRSADQRWRKLARHLAISIVAATAVVVVTVLFFFSLSTGDFGA